MQSEQSLAASTPLSRVGESITTRKALAYRQAVERLYRRGATIDDLSTLVMSINDALYREAARLNGVSATPEDFDAISRHADQNSRNPELLAQIKGVFGEDTEAYRRIFLEPKIIPTKLRDFFSRHRSHDEARRKIEQARTEILAEADLAGTAQKHGLNFQELTLEEPDTTPQEQLPYPIEFAEDPVLRIAKSLQVGEVHGDVIETGQEYLLLRLHQRTGSSHVLEIVSVKRPVFGDWFREQASKVEIVIEDAALFEQIREQYAHVWWLADVKGPGAEAESKG